MTSVPLLDTDHLARATFEDRDLEAELLDLFRDQCRRLAPLLAGDAPRTERREGAHTLKGAARAIGAARLAAALERVEEGLAGDADVAPLAALADFAAALGPTLAAIEERRALHPA
jgi:HPt (histidine-containing phosphotransfer) domain-containing protein